MTDVLEQYHYFVSPVYTIKKPEFLETVRKASNEALSVARKTTKIDDVYPILQVDMLSDERMHPFFDYVINTAWNLLNDQGYAMEGLSTYFTEGWCQEHHKTSSMESHHHSDSQLVAFYFTECPKDSPRLVIHDPRAAKAMVSLPQQVSTKVSIATSMVNFVPEAGTLMFANAWLPHSITRNPSTKPFKFIHMNIATRPYVEPAVYENTADII